MAAKQQVVTVKIPKGYSELERVAIAQEIVDYIRDRTASGRDKDEKRFPGYSDSYAGNSAKGIKPSTEFKIAGKSRGNVNLRLSGDMMTALGIVDVGRTNIRIGYDAGDEINGKVEGNRIGSYGQPRGNPKLARDFLGIKDSALQKILRRYPQSERRREDSLLQAEKIVSAGEAARDFLAEGNE